MNAFRNQAEYNFNRLGKRVAAMIRFSIQEPCKKPPETVKQNAIKVTTRYGYM